MRSVNLTLVLVILPISTMYLKKSHKKADENVFFAVEWRLEPKTTPML
jgi:hypothetical protein